MARNNFVLKPFKNDTLTSERRDDHLKKLKLSIQKIHAHEPYNMSFEELYRMSYQLVLHKHGDMLYEGVVETIRAHLTGRAESLRGVPDDTLLQRVKEVWEAHGREMSLVRDILMYMDKTFVPTNPSRKVIWDQGLSLFRGCVLGHSGLRGRVTAQLVSAFAGARAGVALDGSLLSSILTMLVDLGSGTLGVYAEEFEAPFLEEAASALGVKSHAFLTAHSCPEYLLWAEGAMESEKAALARCGHPTTLPKLSALLEKTLVADHAVALVELPGSGLRELLERGDAEARSHVARLHKLFTLCKAPVQWLDRGGAGAAAAASPDQAVGATGSSSSSSGGKLRTLPPLGIMRESFKSFVLHCGRALLAESKDASAYVQQLVLLRRRHADGLVEHFLGGDKDFLRALKEAMETLLNAPGDTRPPEYLCVFLDEMFRGGFREKSEGEVDECMSQVVVLFRFLHNKDEFEERYKCMLQRRLLGGKVISDDYEKLMISKLKTECGFQFTSKLEGMFNDLRVSRDLTDKFRADRALFIDHLAAGPTPSSSSSSSSSSTSSPAPPKGTTWSPATTAALQASAALVAGSGERGSSSSGGGSGSGEAASTTATDVDFTVLTRTNWPTSKFPPCTLPRSIAASADAFRAYYLSIHTGRRLEWFTEKGTAEVLFHLSPQQRHELTVSTYQMCALLLFNDLQPGGGITFGEVTAQCGVPAGELSRHLLSLLVPKYKVLNRSSKGKELLPEEVLSVNTGFASKFFRVRVPLISASSLVAGGSGGGGGSSSGGGGGSGEGSSGGGGKSELDEDVQAQVESQRKTMTDAAIVRIMKARKSLDIGSLVMEAIRQLSVRFEPSSSDIKKRVEDLIERDYLERDASDNKILTYCA